jgi:protein-tyrosine phosphatase
MALSLIDVTPMHPGWGRVFQSGVIASEDWDQKGLVISLAGNENWMGPCLWLLMPDSDMYVLPDTFLVAMVDATIAFLKKGIDVLIHCNEGKYRSSYLDAAVHMRAGPMTYHDAFALIRQHHPIAGMRGGTYAQLNRMEAILQGAS